MSVSIGGTTGVTFSDASVQNTAATGFGFKNRIINGAMMIDQRNAGASVTPAGTAYFLDRWQFAMTPGSKFSIQQNAGGVTPPTGFSSYLGVTSTSAYSIGSGDLFIIQQPVEVCNMYDLAFGTASAKPVTLSFWARSSLTGTFGGYLGNGLGSPYSYPFNYTISAANTWQYVTISVPAPTAGTWNTTVNSGGLYVGFSLGVGTTYSGPANAWSTTAYYAPTGNVNVAGTNGATFYITGVQLEKGSTATSFDYRPYSTELQLAQRYYSVNTINVYASSQPAVVVPFKVSMRTSPTLSGGGAGFNTVALNTEVMQPYQTTVALQSISASAEL